MYWNYYSTLEELKKFSIKSNMWCIETFFHVVTIHDNESIKSNMWCIETAVNHHFYFCLSDKE